MQRFCEGILLAMKDPEFMAAFEAWKNSEGGKKWRKDHEERCRKEKRESNGKT